MKRIKSTPDIFYKAVGGSVWFSTTTWTDYRPIVLQRISVSAKNGGENLSRGLCFLKQEWDRIEIC